MSEYEEEIEYLDEDADIVQQCVQTISTETPKLTKPVGKQKPASEREYFRTAVKRKTRSTKPKKKYAEEDSDYVPENEKSDSDASLSLRPPKTKKGGTIPQKMLSTPPKTQAKPAKPSSKPLKKSTYSISRPEPWSITMKKDIRIPDYEDPICLPVKHYKVHNFEKAEDPLNSTLSLWNQLCLENLATASAPLKPNEGSAIKSLRTLTFRKEISNIGEAEMCVKGVTSVLNLAGEEVSEMYKAPLPRYKEQRHFDFNFADRNQQPNYVKPQKSTVQLSKEIQDEKEYLISYKAEEGTLSIYDTVENESDNEESLNRDPNDTSRRYLQETVRCRQCVSCYQLSHRLHTDEKKSLKIKCPVCSRETISVYNLLRHLRTHTNKEVRAHAHNVAHNISKILEYHYKCRICSKNFLSIKKLRTHLNTHTINQSFNCDVCNKTKVVTQ